MLNEGEKCRKTTYSAKTESLVRMGQGFIYVLLSLLFNLRKAPDEVAKEVTCCLNGCIADIAETATDVTTKYGTVVLYKSYGVLFEVPFVRSVLR